MVEKDMVEREGRKEELEWRNDRPFYARERAREKEKESVN